MHFVNRKAAGRKLAEALGEITSEDAIVLALPRGGIVLGSEVARVLHAPLDVLLVRKIGHPAYVEYAVGAVAEGCRPIYNEAGTASLDEEWLTDAVRAARQMIAYRRKLYFGSDYRSPTLEYNTVIIIDDGIATGLTMQAAAAAVQAAHPAHIVIASPVASPESLSRLRGLADELVILDSPANFAGSIGAHYLEFPQVNDDTVKSLLRQNRLYSQTTRLKAQP